MSFLDTLKQGHILSGGGMFELPSVNDVITKIESK